MLMLVFLQILFFRDLSMIYNNFMIIFFHKSANDIPVNDVSPRLKFAHV